MTRKRTSLTSCLGLYAQLGPLRRRGREGNEKVANTPPFLRVLACSVPLIEYPSVHRSSCVHNAQTDNENCEYWQSKSIFYTAHSQNSISLDQAQEIPGYLAKSLDNTILHGKRVARAIIVDAMSLSTVIQ